MCNHLEFPPPILRLFLPAMKSHEFLRYLLGVSKSTVRHRQLVESPFKSNKDYEQVSGIYLTVSVGNSVPSNTSDCKHMILKLWFIALTHKKQFMRFSV